MFRRVRNRERAKGRREKKAGRERKRGGREVGWLALSDHVSKPKCTL